MTFIEVLVTIALVTVAIIGIAADVAATERVANISQQQSQLEVQMRQATDYIRDSSAAGLAYIPCANDASYHLPWTWATVHVSESPYFGPGNIGNGGTRNGFATAPLYSSGCAANTADWGVQEIKVTVSGSGSTLQRTVWKSQRWCWNGAPC